MSRPIVLTGGRVIDPSRNVDQTADVLIQDGKVAAIGPSLGRPDGADVRDVAGRVVAPGLVDLHVHLREPGNEDEETVASGARAAAAGGFTAVCAMPNTDPVTDNQAAVGFIVRQSGRAGFARVHPIGAVTIGQKGERLAEFGEMVGAGAVAVSDDGRPVVSSHMMRTALEYARTFNIPVADHCEDPTLFARGVMHEGLVSTRLGLKGIPAAAEEIMVARDILLAELTRGHVHLCHISARGSVAIIREAKERGIRVTAEVTPHHLTLTDYACEEYDTHAKMNPPLREAADVAALRGALKDGVIDCIASDHAPHAYDEKEAAFDDAPFGVVGLETAFAVAHTELVEGGVFTLPELTRRMSTEPARVFHLAGGGRDACSRCRRRCRGVRHRGEVVRGSGGIPFQEPQHAVCGPCPHGARDPDDRGRRDRSRSGSNRYTMNRGAVARRMALCCRQLAAQGLMAGRDGNLSVRLSPERVLVTPSGFIKSLVTPAGMVEVDFSEKPRGRGSRKPTSELELHLRILRHRPDVQAVVHAHPPAATGFAVAGEAIPGNLLPELIFVVGPVALVPYGMSGTPELGDQVVPYLDTNDALLLANHGAVTMGGTLDEAWIRMESLEHSARLILTPRQVGQPQPLSLEAVRVLVQQREKDA